MARNVKKIVVQVEKRVKPDVVLDDIFFHKSQVAYGTDLVYYGRLEPLSEWQVVKIESHFLGKIVGEVSVKKTNEVRLLSDIITVQSSETGQKRQMSFAYLSYSALWRIK